MAARIGGTFQPAKEGEPRCVAMVYRDVYGRKLEPPRRCVRPAKTGGEHCGLHRSIHAKHAKDGLLSVTVREGGYCVWCGEPGASFECEDELRVPVRLCRRHARAIARSVRDVYGE